MGVATQCLKSSKVFKANIQYWANVLLKVNVKLGGVNLIPDQASVSVLSDPNTPTIVLGADVIHPAPGLIGVPSYAALVGNVDANVSKYIAVTRVQNSRVEIIENLEEMCKYILRQYVGYRKEVERTSSPLKRLIFYRDGVSEGQFQQVLDQELPQIQSACREFGLQPKITLIIVGKRHHMRFKPLSDGDADRSGNAPAGTVVDKDLGHPTEFDFYLQSHGGLLGTSRSSHYSVLYDDNGFNADTLQALSFALCHVYARSTRSVSIPAPVYYADIVCARAKFHYDPNANFSMSETMSQASEGSAALERYKAGFKALHPNQAGHMYFM
jgi:eukaryotic translation initiation factor 2C